MKKLPLLGYGVAVLSSALAVALTQALAPWVEPALFTLLFAAVMVSAWRGGRGPGLLATLLCALGGLYLFLQSPNVAAYSSAPGILLRLALFVGVCGLITSLTDHLRAARQQAERLSGEQAARREAETLRQQSEEALATLDGFLTSSPIGFGLWDRDLCCLRINAALSALGDGATPPEKHLGRPLQDVLPPLASVLEPQIRQVFVTGDSLLNLEVGSETRTFLASYFPVRHGDGQVFGVGAALRDVSERKQAEAERERSRQRWHFLAEASIALSSAALDYEATLERVARLAVPLLADYCLVDIVGDDGFIRRLAVAHADPAEEALAQELRRYPPHPTGSQGVPKALRTRQPEIYADITEADLANLARSEPHLHVLRRLGPRSGMTVPLFVGESGRALGALSFAYTGRSGRRHTPDDLALAEDLARRAALALDNARLYHAQQTIAQTLQQSLLPPLLVEVPHIEVAACYHPVGAGVEVGGDFYDLFESRNGAWDVVLGDVSGKGPEAAAVTALVRYAARAAAMRLSEPGQILSLLNDAVCRQTSGERFCTMAYLCLEPPARRGAVAHLTVGVAGHPLPLLVRKKGTVEAIGQPGMVLGAVPDLPFGDESADLFPGDSLVLYTDGVIEARRPRGEGGSGGGDLYGEERLAALLRSCAGLTAQALLKRVESDVMAFQSNDPADDIAILVLRVPE